MHLFTFNYEFKLRTMHATSVEHTLYDKDTIMY